MHLEAKAFIARIANELDIGDQMMHALDLGGRETNGHARDVFGDNIDWLVIDAVDGPGVDIVADAATWDGDNRLFDLILCAEVFEHTPRWPLIIHNAGNLLWAGAPFIVTMAGPGREVHGLNHDDPDQPGWYENIEPRWLAIALQAAGFNDIHVEPNYDSHDVYGWARQ